MEKEEEKKEKILKTLNLKLPVEEYNRLQAYYIAKEGLTLRAHTTKYLLEEAKLITVNIEKK